MQIFEFDQTIWISYLTTLPFVLDIESAALVERLLNEVLQTTEAFQKLKNENAVIANEATLNGQSMAPLQQENERLVKENNDLHF